MATVSVLRCQRSKALQDIEQAQYSTAMRGHQHPRTARQQIEHSMSISAPLRVTLESARLAKSAITPAPATVLLRPPARTSTNNREQKSRPKFLMLRQESAPCR